MIFDRTNHRKLMVTYKHTEIFVRIQNSCVRISSFSAMSLRPVHGFEKVSPSVAYTSPKPNFTREIWYKLQYSTISCPVLGTKIYVQAFR